MKTFRLLHKDKIEVCVGGNLLEERAVYVARFSDHFWS